MIQLESRYAPLRSDAKAILRQKTLLGETYVELTPGHAEARRRCPEGGSLRTTQISPTVELDEIYRSFDPRTRRAFQVWMQTQAQAIKGHGRDINDALGNLGPFAEDAERRGRHPQPPGGGGPAADLQHRRGVRRADRARRPAARADRELQPRLRHHRGARPRAAGDASSRCRPSSASRARRSTASTRSPRDTDPLVTQLRPAARELSPTLTDLSALAPDLKALFRDLDKVITVSRTGFPAAERILRDLRPLLAQADPALRQLIPILEVLGAYKGELTAFFANTAAATQAFDPGTRLHYLRTTNPLNPENLAAYPRRIGSNRPEPLPAAGRLPQARGRARGLRVAPLRPHRADDLDRGAGPGAGRRAAVPGLPALPVPGADRRADGRAARGLGHHAVADRPHQPVRVPAATARARAGRARSRATSRSAASRRDYPHLKAK